MNTAPQNRALVVGAGIMGLSAAWALVKQGYQVELFEQGDIPNPLASSVEYHRIIRHPYGKEEGYSRMACAAFEAWERLWQDLGQCLYQQTGILALEKPGISWMEDSAAVLEKLAIPFQWLDHTELVQRYPLLTLHNINRGLFLEQGGILMAQAIITALAQWLQAHGVTLHSQSKVTDLNPEQSSLTLSNGQQKQGDILIITAGAWVTELLPSLATRLTPSRQILLYVEPDGELMQQWRTMPVPFDAEVYMIPPVGALNFVKLANHTFTFSGHPDHDREPSAAELASHFQKAQSLLQHPERYRLLGGTTCFYTVEAQEHFIIEPLGQTAWVLSPCSGHGFKFGPILGEALADTLNGKLSPSILQAWAVGNPQYGAYPVG